MVYIMEFFVDGGCRGNGKPGSYGAAAAIFKPKYGRQKRWYEELPWTQSPVPTNQRAEISAIILALRQALARYEDLNSNPYFKVTIHSDSQYAVNCMNNWVHKWRRNGWRNAAGYEVVNRDLIESALELDNQLEEVGEVRYVWISRADNQDADELCNDVMDDM